MISNEVQVCASWHRNSLLWNDQGWKVSQQNSLFRSMPRHPLDFQTLGCLRQRLSIDVLNPTDSRILWTRRVSLRRVCTIHCVGKRLQPLWVFQIPSWPTWVLYVQGPSRLTLVLFKLFFSFFVSIHFSALSISLREELETLQVPVLRKNSRRALALWFKIWFQSQNDPKHFHRLQGSQGLKTKEQTLRTNIKIDGGWPESAEEHVAFMLLERECNEYKKMCCKLKMYWSWFGWWTEGDNTDDMLGSKQMKDRKKLQEKDRDKQTQIHTRTEHTYTQHRQTSHRHRHIHSDTHAHRHTNTHRHTDIHHTHRQDTHTHMRPGFRCRGHLSKAMLALKMKQPVSWRRCYRSIAQTAKYCKTSDSLSCQIGKSWCQNRTDSKTHTHTQTSSHKNNITQPNIETCNFTSIFAARPSVVDAQMLHKHTQTAIHTHKQAHTKTISHNRTLKIASLPQFFAARTSVVDAQTLCKHAHAHTHARAHTHTLT